jgi:hypothetical protein
LQQYLTAKYFNEDYIEIPTQKGHKSFRSLITLRSNLVIKVSNAGIHRKISLSFLNQHIKSKHSVNIVKELLNYLAE